jgi:endonuclease/exonuclease/phosphatase family metal-dependent hydrolase
VLQVLDVPTPILPLFEDAASAVPLHEMSDPATAHKWHTLKYYGKAEPVVTVDYCLHSPADWKVEHVRVPREYGWPSDHAPLVASLRVVQ